MEILKYRNLGDEDKIYWRSLIGSCGWRAGDFLFSLLGGKKDEAANTATGSATVGACEVSEVLFEEACGEGAQVLLLVEGRELVSFCTYAPLDDVQPTLLTPWIGFVFTAEEYRGRRCAGELISYAEGLAREDGHEFTHISTDHVGLYEKYGYELYQMAKSLDGEDARVYRKKL